MKKIKVLHIITSLGSGGAEGMLYRLILASNHSVDHSVICLNKGGKYVSLLKKENIDVLVLNLKLATSLKGLVPILKFSQLKKKQGYDIITSWLYHADFVAWSAGGAWRGLERSNSPDESRSWRNVSKNRRK